MCVCSKKRIPQSELCAAQAPCEYALARPHFTIRRGAQYVVIKLIYTVIHSIATRVVQKVTEMKIVRNEYETYEIFFFQREQKKISIK